MVWWDSTKLLHTFFIYYLTFTLSMEMQCSNYKNIFLLLKQVIWLDQRWTAILSYEFYFNENGGDRFRLLH